ncbi:MAG TPA: L-lactate permease [Phycisphaerae bacterium]|jgi:lactate permease
MWTQNYTPLGNLFLSALVAALPVIVLLGLLAFSKFHAHIAALAGLATSLLIAILVYGMPAKLAGMAAVYGAAYGLFPIGWIVLGAIFVYDISVQTGQFEIVKRSVAGLAADRRIQAILIAFSFGAFIEGAAGFGTPVAISAAMLIGLGFRPLPAAGLALIGNTAPVAFGALGTPIVTLASVTKIPAETLSAMVGRQLPIFSLIIPFWLIWAMAGRKKMLEVWPACLTAGLSFGIVQFFVSNYHGPWVVDIAASLASMGSMLILLRFWQPRTVWRFDHEEAPASATSGKDGITAALAATVANAEPETLGAIEAPDTQGAAALQTTVPAEQPLTPRRVLVAWLPWIIVSVLVFTWGVPQVKTFFDAGTQIKIPVSGLDKLVFRAPPVVPATKPGESAKPEDVVFVFNWLSATGTGLLVAGIISGFVLGLNPLKLTKVFAGTLFRVRWSLLTIVAMLAIGNTTRYAGLDATMGLAFASTGLLFPFFSPILGWLGVALTGSDTASNVLFGNLQQITAHQLGISSVLAAASNSSGGVMGKMIDAQSIVVAGVATGQRGGEGRILRYVFFHSVALAILVGVLVMVQAHWLQSWIPVAPLK